MTPNKAKKDFYLTDGGLETTLIFHYDISLPHFAAFTLLQYQAGREALKRYYLPYLQLAKKQGVGFILETPTWRANTDWGFKLGYTQAELDAINQRAVRFVRTLGSSRTEETNAVLISGNIGPRGDGYVIEKAMTLAEASAYHLPQIKAFVKSKVDLVTALTINYAEEAMGIIVAAEQQQMDVAISFTVETDGRLPSGEKLQSAIERTDQQTNAYASHYMINCAHPEHFSTILHEGGEWVNRIHGIRANASAKSHAELDESTSLDIGDKCQLANDYSALKGLLPALRIVGGCCGTDHTHLEMICEQFFSPMPA